MKIDSRARQYARLLTECGVRIKKGQMLVITIPVEHACFARLLQEEAYTLGASLVVIRYEDDLAKRNDYIYAKESVLKKVNPSSLLQKKEEQDAKCAYLHIISDDPNLTKGVDIQKMMRVNKEQRKAFKPYQDYTMSSKGQWCVAAVSNPAWAKKVFPEIKDPQEADEALMKAIYKTVGIGTNKNPVEAFKKHAQTIEKHRDQLNALQLTKLHFKNECGTDLTVELPEHHIWGGCAEYASVTKTAFDPNVPTEEVFTTPLRTGVNGHVVSSKPLYYQGCLIEDFSFTFKNGKVISYKARKGKEALDGLFASDPNANRLGEVALVPYHSPISNSGLIFYETLFDENAACHLALGASYPAQIEGGEKLSEKELMARGGNVANVHVDFMFGTKDLEVTGTTKGNYSPIEF